MSRLDPRTLVTGLNPEQAAAVTHGDGPLLVLAGAGSGKTRVLTNRLAWLVAHGAAEPSLVALTFTNKAAGEMRERAAKLLSAERPRSFVGTFHAYCVRMLRRFAEEAGVKKSFVVLDADDQLTLVKRAMKEKAVPEKAFTPRGLQSKISQAKNAGLAPDEFVQRWGDYLGSIVAGVYIAYEKALESSASLDFDDLLVRTSRLLKTNSDVLLKVRGSVRHLLVDEFQDTNRIQARIVRSIVGEKGNIFAVGDEDQSIYRWRGADVSNILEFSRDYPTAQVVRLERNYRSKAPILQAAGAVVAENERRLGKTLRAERAGGDKVRLLTFDEERDEAREVITRIAALQRSRPDAHAAVLFRTNAQSRPFEDELLRRRIAYLVVGGIRFYERAEVKDAIAYLRLSRNPDDDLSFRRVVNVPARGVGAVTLEGLQAAAAERGVSLFGATERLPDGLTDRARRALAEFRELVLKLGERSREEGAGAEAAVHAALSESGLLALYEGTSDPEDETRRENLNELLAAAREHEREVARSGEGDPGIAGFLDAVTLRSDADEVDERRQVLLLTVHAAKGLEFDEVFFVGMEDGNLPHASSRDEPEELEEERRLAYVGMTRAKDRLTLSHVRRRMVHGEWVTRFPSPFLDAIPRGVLEREDFSLQSQGFGRGAERGFGGRGAESLFPDYEGESQERVERAPVFRAPVFRAPAARPYTRPVMKRTPPPPTASGFKRGSRVAHPEYGVGVVMTVEGSGDAEKLTVYFERTGRRKFVAKYSNLRAV